MRHNVIHIVRASLLRDSSPGPGPITLPNLQALIVLPKRHFADEVIIWIKSETIWPLFGGSQASINVTKLQSISGQLMWQHGTHVVKLDYKLKEAQKCSISVSEISDAGIIKVIVAHDGKVEKKCINVMI
jgi:hypothetical protein